MPSRQPDRPEPMADALLTPAQVAAWLKVKPRQLIRYKVPHVRLGKRTVRYLRADVVAWLDRQKQGAA
jgi:hypothetical protein